MEDIDKIHFFCYNEHDWKWYIISVFQLKTYFYGKEGIHMKKYAKPVVVLVRRGKMSLGGHKI